jgi:hypothetical protein
MPQNKHLPLKIVDEILNHYKRNQNILHVDIVAELYPKTQTNPKKGAILTFQVPAINIARFESIYNIFCGLSTPISLAAKALLHELIVSNPDCALYFSNIKEIKRSLKKRDIVVDFEGLKMVRMAFPENTSGLIQRTIIDAMECLKTV